MALNLEHNTSQYIKFLVHFWFTKSIKIKKKLFDKYVRCTNPITKKNQNNYKKLKKYDHKTPEVK